MFNYNILIYCNFFRVYETCPHDDRREPGDLGLEIRSLDLLRIITHHFKAAGGVAVRFSPIPGWCIFPPDLHTEGRQLVEGTMQELVILTSIGDCGQIEAAKASVGSVPDDAYVAATKALLETDLGDDRAGFV